MRWTPSNLMTTMQNLLSGRVDPDDRRTELMLESIREAMLLSLSAQAAHTFPVVELRVTYASSIQDLWYLRSDLMSAIATTSGEKAARQQINRISDMFTGYLPKGLCSRPSPLGDR
jgi:hypothetical protein